MSDPQNDSSGKRALNNHFKSNPQLISVCAFETHPTKAIAPPSATPDLQLGFVNLYDDS
ncbi:MAG: hypothetical protein AAGE96_05470 [Cyanobacteria bacterium P01_G01_bin.19]